MFIVPTRRRTAHKAWSDVSFGQGRSQSVCGGGGGGGFSKTHHHHQTWKRK